MSSRWNHNSCWSCYVENNITKEGTIRLPCRIIKPVDENGTDLDLQANCCWCGQLNIEGIYVRQDPATLDCAKNHTEEE